MKSARQKEAGNELLLSYLTLRTLIGFLGMGLPVFLWAFTSRAGNDRATEASISEYYYTSSGDVFVVTLSSIAMFLLTYRGYSRGDTWWSNAAALGALGVVFFPTASAYERVAPGVHTINKTVPTLFGSTELHLLFAALFFVAIAILCLFYFTRTDDPRQLRAEGSLTPKAKRNLVYRVCGWLIFFCIAGIGLYAGTNSAPTPGAAPASATVFVLETIAVEAFGFAWLVKGQVFWPDRRSHLLTLFEAET